MELWQSLPEDFRVTAIIALGSAGFLLGLYLLGRLLTFRRPESPIPSLLVVAGALALMGSISVYLDRQPTIPGIVEAKAEHIDIETDGSWSSVLHVRVRYTPPGESEPRSDDLSADEAIYDRVSVGDRVDVRFLHLGGWFTFARLSERSTLSILLGRWPQLTPILLAVGLLLLVWRLAVAVKYKLLTILALAALIAFVFLITSVPQWKAVRPLTGTQTTTVATVRKVTQFTEVSSGEDSEEEVLVQPFDLVELEFVPEERRDPVMAADIIDAGSLPLEIGGTVTVRYLVEQPRTVRLEGGTRSYAWKNTLSSLASMGFVLLFLGGLIIGGRLISRRHRSNIDRNLPGVPG